MRWSPPRSAIEHLEHDVLHPGGNPAAAGHLAYIPGGGLYHAALGDYLGAVSNKYAGIFFTGPGPVRMENMLIRWVADLVGSPELSKPFRALRMWLPLREQVAALGG
ncbi:MAG TPA: hypothetical protein VKM72_33420 [Thermoanaerobaculia bacterium]|nr:hypothetical protein [Thermoanaerobaculia bacterium]